MCAFLDCKSLRAVYCYAENVPKTGSRTFNEPYMERVTLYVPESSLEDYKRKSPWKEFGTILPLSKEMEDIENIKLNANTWENFDLFGRKLNYSNTGIRIVNGKKVIR